MRSGVALGALAYLLWGASALYWPLLLPAGPAEILSVRVVSSFAVLVLLLTLLGRWPAVQRVFRQPRQLRLLAAAAVLIALNWGVFIYATTHGQVIEAALGYFTSPLVMVALGVVVLAERPRPLQWLAVGFGAAGLALLVIAHGHVPWIALTLAGTFGLYAVAKKRARVRTLESLTVETGLLLLPAVAYLVVLQVTGTAEFGHGPAAHTLLMLGAGPVMAVPLLLFGAAANRASLTTVGLLQYIEPVVQFLIGLVVFGEAMPAARWAAFCLVWVAIVVLVVESRLTARRLPVVTDAGVGR